jgi:TP901 family phage tail tape measure protein
MANKKLSAIITIGGAVASTLIGSIDKTKTKLGEVGTALKNLEAQQRKLGQTIQTFGQQGKSVEGMRNRYQALTQQVERLRAANERLLKVEKARTANQEKQAQLRQQFGDTAMVGAAIALPAVALFGKAAQFNYDLQVIGNTANLTSDQIKQMGMNIVRTSDETGQSAETIKNATGFLIAAGQSINQVSGNIRAIGRTSTAAAAEIEDVAKASFVLGDALKIGEGQAMQDAMDALVQSGKEGNFEFKAMAAELPVLAGAFQALKFTGQDAVASMGAYLQIARKGASTEAEAANNFNNFLAKILSPETLKKAEKLGSDLYGVVKKAQDSGQNPIEAALKEINRITKGGDQKLLGEIFGDMQVQNFVRPALQNIEEYERIKAKALNSRGVVDKDFATMMATDKLAIDELKNAFSGLGKTIGDAVAPVIKSVAVAMTPVIRSARDFVAANPQLVGGLIVAAGAFTTLRLAIIGTRLAAAMLGGQMLSVSALGARVQAAAAMGTGALVTLKSAAAAVTGGLATMGRAMLWALNPMNLIRAGSALVVSSLRSVAAAATMATARLFAFGKASAGAALSGVRALGAGLMAFATAPIATTVLALRTAGAAMLSFAKGGVAAAVAGIRTLGAVILANPIGLALTAIATGALMIYRHWDGVAAFFRGVGEGLVSGLQPVIGSFDKLTDSLGFLKPAFTLVGDALSAAWNWFTNLLQPVQYSSEELTKAGAAGKTFGEMLAAGINFALFPLQKLIEGITWINNNIGSVIGKLNEFGSAVGTKTFDAVQKVKNFFGGDETPAPASAPAATGSKSSGSVATPAGSTAAVPALPAMATDRKGGATITDSSQNTFNIYQQPGQDSRKLADEIARQQEQRRKVQQRGALYDGAMAQ